MLFRSRPSPDHANARFILLLSAHLESGHYFNPHAQRIIDGKMAGAKLAVMDPSLSNTASMADYWMPTYPGTEAAVLLAMAKVILDENRFDVKFVKNWPGASGWCAGLARPRSSSTPPTRTATTRWSECFSLPNFPMNRTARENTNYSGCP